MVKQLPTPSSLVSPTCPPWSSTIRFTSANPKPVPEYWRFKALSIWIKGWKSRGTWSGAMPMPVSVTAIRRKCWELSFPLARVKGVISRVIFPDSGVNLTALLSRLIKTWRMRRLSTKTLGSGLKEFLISNRMSFLSACCLMKVRLDLHRESRSVGVQFSSIWPDSIFATSRMSLINSRRWEALLSTVCKALSWSWLISPKTCSCNPSVIPRIALRGVRSSWLILARNSSLRRVALDSSMLRSLISCCACCLSVSSFCSCSKRLACWMAIANWLAICWVRAISDCCQGRTEVHWWIHSSPHNCSPQSRGITRLAWIWNWARTSIWQGLSPPW